MKITQSKSTLKLKLQVVISEGNCPIPETVNFIRMQRAGSNRVHKLTPEMPAPAKPAILTNTKNKIQLNAMLAEGLLSSDYYTNATQKHSLATAGVSDLPMEMIGGVRIDRHDLCSTYEEADIIITQHAISGKCVRVVCYGTDVFVLLAHFYHIKHRGRNSAPVIMTSLVKEQAGIHIGATATAYCNTADDLLAIQGISRADIVASLHGVG